MRNSLELELLLTSSPPSSSLSVDAKLEVQSQGFLLSFEITGKGVNQVLINDRNPKPIRKKDLWKETCFECFFGVGGTKNYFEFNGSSSGDWALYSFDDYRQGMKDVPVSANPVMEKFEKSPSKIICVWRIPYFTKNIIQNASFTAVIKTSATSDEVSYWALKHTGEKPDFHLRNSFIHRFI